MMKWLHANGCPFDESACTEAAIEGHIDTLKWLHENGFPWNQDTFTSSAAFGHFEILIWLHQQGCPFAWDEDTCFDVTESGYIDTLQWFQQKGCSLYLPRSARMAARGDQLDMLQYLHEQQPIRDELTCAEAARGGNLEVLK